MAVPWVVAPTDYRQHHISIERLGTEIATIWQAWRHDGDYVRISETGYADPGSPISGDARVTGDRHCGLTVAQDTVTLWDPDFSSRVPVPSHLHHEHMEWHADSHNGVEFLEFHRSFLNRFRQWYTTQPSANLALIEPWQSLPPEFDQPDDENAKRRFTWVHELETNPSGYGSTEELGTAIQRDLHRWLHNVPITTVYRDTLITDFNTAPETGHFYQMHGFIDRLWRGWDFGHYATYVKQQGTPASIQVGQPFTVHVTMSNHSRFPWPAGGPVQLACLDPHIWHASPSAPASAVAAPVSYQDPNKQKRWRFSETTFDVALKAPTAPGHYQLRWRMRVDDESWFGELSPPMEVRVEPSPGHTAVPRVIGLSRSEAFGEIREAGLIPASTGGGTAVYDQNPKAGSLVAIGSKVVCQLRGGPRDSKS